MKCKLSKYQESVRVSIGEVGCGFYAVTDEGVGGYFLRFQANKEHEELTVFVNENDVEVIDSTEIDSF